MREINVQNILLFVLSYVDVSGVIVERYRKRNSIPKKVFVTALIIIIMWMYLFAFIMPFRIITYERFCSSMGIRKHVVIT